MPAGAAEGSIYSLTWARKVENSVEAEAVRLAASTNVGEADAERRNSRTWKRGEQAGGIKKPEEPEKPEKRKEKKPGKTGTKQGRQRPPAVRK